MSTSTTLVWSDALVLGDARTDATHQEFIDMVNATAACTAEQQLPQYQALLAHTVEHFAQEERWMRACGIAPDFCHFGQHNSVLEVMKEVERRALLGETEFINTMLEALVEWFPEHASSMDAGLVSYLREKGFDTASETFLDGAPRAGAAERPSCSSHDTGHACASHGTDHHADHDEGHVCAGKHEPGHVCTRRGTGQSCADREHEAGHSHA
jgi:hemerythrin-like metal-binding protein